MSACCGPTRPETDGAEDSLEPAQASAAVTERADSSAARENASALAAMVAIPAARFRMGSADRWAYAADGEGPIHNVEVSGFRIDPTAVTNARFAEFIAATGYVTDAQRFGWSFVFAGLLPDDFEETRAVASAPWWRQVYGAQWSAPEGPQSDFADRQDHPVVQVSWRDADAFCQWAGTRLPTEAEWEYAARGGLDGAAFPWGDELEPDGEHRMNVFQGTFPQENSQADGFAGTAPVDAFAPNGFGLYNMTGNVWEWCSDWYDASYYSVSALQDPKGAAAGSHRVMRGGSYLCHESYCRRYRVAARSGNGPDSTTGNLGFRCVSGL
jgi:formylglycine-generating enzyme required for sulfatase activity